MGLALGSGLSFVAEQLKPCVYREEDIIELGHAVFGTVPPLTTPAESRSAALRNMMEWTMAALMVATIPTVTLVTYLRG